MNQTINTLSVNGNEVAILGKVGIINTTTLSTPGMLHLEARISYSGGLTALKSGTMIVYRKGAILRFLYVILHSMEF